MILNKFDKEPAADSKNEIKNQELSNCLNGKYADSQIIYEDSKCLAFNENVSPVAKVHVLIVAKQNDQINGDMRGVKAEDSAIMGHLMVVASKVANKLGLSRDDAGYRVVVNNGKDAAAPIAEHCNKLIVHVIGG